MDLIETLYRKRSRYVLKDSYTKWVSVNEYKKMLPKQPAPIVYLLCPYRQKDVPYAETVHGQPVPVKIRINRYECYVSYFPKTEKVTIEIEGVKTIKEPVKIIEERIDFDIGYGFHGLPPRSQILDHRVFNIREGWSEDSIVIYVADLIVRRNEERAMLSEYYCRACKRYHSVFSDDLMERILFTYHEAYKPRLRDPKARTFFCTKHQRIHTIPKRTKGEPEEAYVNRLRKRWKYAKCLPYAYKKNELLPIIKKVIKSK